MKIKRIVGLLMIFSFFSMIYAENKINITIDGQTFSATLAKNETAETFKEKLIENPIEITMNNYGGFEKVGALPWSLPTDDERITTRPGDIMLYNGNNIVIFYGSNTWSYTPLGILDITEPDQISKFVGNGTKHVIISLDNLSQMSDVLKDAETMEKVYTIDGKEVTKRPLPSGIYIIDNKKVRIK